jgi:hypothetical protein
MLFERDASLKARPFHIGLYDMISWLRFKIYNLTFVESTPVVVIRLPEAAYIQLRHSVRVECAGCVASANLSIVQS